MSELPVTKETLLTYLQEDDFITQLKRLAPMITASRLAEIIEIAEKGGSNTKLQANLELLKAFMPVVTEDLELPSFDSSVRKVKAEAKEIGTGPKTMQDAIEIIASDPFLQIELERKKEEKVSNSNRLEEETSEIDR